MKVYFTTNVLEIEHIRKEVDFIFKCLSSKSFKVSKFNYKRNPNAQFEINKDNQEMITSFKYICDCIKTSDFTIAELTYSSAAVGFEVAFALNERKPTLVLYNQEKVKALTTPFRGNQSKYLKIYPYQNLDDLRDRLKFFIKIIPEMLDKRFNLNISPEIDRYLHWASALDQKSKAEITRDSLENTMMKDKRYKKYLDSLSNLQ